MKYRTEERTRMVPETRDGRTHMIPETYKVKVPVAPRDWDAIALRAVRVAAALAVAGEVTWSTVAIGGLLSEMAPEWTAYLVASVFSLAWVVCMVLEWLSRYDQDRARLPVVCGWIFLAVSVTLIVIHGAQNGSLVIGACGGAVSVLAKGMWAVVMRHTAVELDPTSQAWLDAERRDMNSQLATVAARRQLSRTRAQTQAEVLALSMGQPDTWTAVPVQDNRTVPDTDRVSVLDKGHDGTPVSLSVPVRDTDTVPVSTPEQYNPPTDSLSGRIFPREFVRGLLSADSSLSNTDLSEAVRSEYGQGTKTDSIRKAIQRARGDLSRTA